MWEQEGPDGIGNVPVNMITARGSDGLIAVGTHGNGIYTSHLPAAPIGISESDGPVSLGMAWPNPAVDVVHADLFLPAAGRVQVEVFDLNGRRVMQRDLGQRPAGNSRFSWDLRGAGGARVPAGTYLLRCAVGGTVRARRIVVR